MNMLEWITRIFRCNSHNIFQNVDVWIAGKTMVILYVIDDFKFSSNWVVEKGIINYG